MQSRYVESKDGFAVHFLEWNTVSSKLPVICIHGNLSNASMFKWIGEALSSKRYENPRQVIAIDIRGCGDSDMPEQGFTLDHFASDIETVMNHLNINKAHFIAYSRGVSYVLQYSLRNPNSVESIVIGDFPPAATKFSEEWANRVESSHTYDGTWDSLYDVISKAMPITREQFALTKDEYFVEKEGFIQRRFKRDFPRKLQQESYDYDLSSAVANINGSILVLKGSKEGSLLSEEQLKLYEQYNANVVRVHDAGHDVFEPKAQVKEVIENFFNDVN